MELAPAKSQSRSLRESSLKPPMVETRCGFGKRTTHICESGSSSNLLWTGEDLQVMGLVT